MYDFVHGNDEIVCVCVSRVNRLAIWLLEANRIKLIWLLACTTSWTNLLIVSLSPFISVKWAMWVVVNLVCLCKHSQWMLWVDWLGLGGWASVKVTQFGKSNYECDHCYYCLQQQQRLQQMAKINLVHTFSRECVDSSLISHTHTHTDACLSNYRAHTYTRSFSHRSMKRCSIQRRSKIILNFQLD